MRMIKYLAAVAAALFITTAFTACNTVEGAGEDLETASEEVQEEM